MRQHKVRLAGIDAPDNRQAFGQVSKQHLTDRVFQKTVTIETSKLDRYKREIGKLLIIDSDIHLEQIKYWLAWHYQQYARNQSYRDRELYACAEDEAREANRGLWRESARVPPWEFRHKQQD